MGYRLMRLHFFVKLFFFRILLIFPDGSIMVFDFRGKIVGPVIFGDEIKIRDRSRVEGCQK